MDLIALPSLAPLATQSSTADGATPTGAIDFTDPTRPMFGGALGSTP